MYPADLEFEWALVANMQRQFKASLSRDAGHTYLLSILEYKGSTNIPSTYKLLHPEKPKKYILFKSTN